MGDDYRLFGASGGSSPSAPGSVICPMCGAESSGSEQRTCSNCGVEFGRPNPQRRETTPPYRLVPGAAVCLGCGAESLTSDRRTCSDCGAVLVRRDSQRSKRRPFLGVVVFTGKLWLRRDKLAAVASALGWRVAVNVSAGTTLLVMGVQDPRKRDPETSTKLQKAESLIASGYKIRIIDEKEFRRLIEAAGQ